MLIATNPRARPVNVIDASERLAVRHVISAVVEKHLLVSEPHRPRITGGTTVDGVER